MLGDSELRGLPVDDQDPFLGEAADEDDELDVESVDTMEASPEDVLDQHVPAYPEMEPEDEDLS